jgi:hypothetical protein
MRRLASALTLLACLAAAPAASAGDELKPGPHQEAVSAGAVSATLDYQLKSSFEASGIRLAITRDGAPAAVQGATLDDPCEGCAGVPLGARDSGLKSLALRDLTGDGEPEAIVDLFTGGAHCCWVMALFGWDPASATYRRLVRNWGDPGYRIVGDGDLVSADDGFAYVFCAFACSVMPVQVFRDRDLRLVDITAERPELIARDLREIRSSLRSARRGPKDERFAVNGILPALCADLYRLGRGAECRRELAASRRRGETPKPYGARVLKFLRKNGYIRG